MTPNMPSPLLCLLPCLGILLAGTLAIKFIPFFRTLSTPQSSRIGNIDGLRGLLAIGVFFHHASCTYAYYCTGSWDNVAQPFFNFAGPGCVAFFFMITGILFWTKAIKSGSKIKYHSLLRSRVRRLVPAYLVSFSLVLLICIWQSGAKFQQPVPTVLWQIGRWFLCGLGGRPDINGQTTWLYNSGVTWTLQYEWMFYLCLPLIASFSASLRRFAVLILLFLICSAIGIVISYESRGPVVLSSYFLLGMTAAMILTNVRLKSFLDRILFLPQLSVVLLIAGIVLFERLRHPLPVILFFPSFLCIVQGRFFPKFMNQPVVLFLGHISYSVYLLHGIVLFVFMYSLNKMMPIESIPIIQYWLWVSFVSILMIFASALSYRFIEHPWIGAGPPVPFSPNMGQSHIEKIKLGEPVDQKMNV